MVSLLEGTGDWWSVMVRRLMVVLSLVVLVLVGACGDGGRPAPAVLSVSIDQEDVELVVGATTTLTVTVEVIGGASRGVEWSSADDGVASVSSEGVVTGVAVGEVDVWASSAVDEGVRDTVTVKVVEASGGAEAEFVVGPDGGIVETELGVGVGVIPGTLASELSVQLKLVVDAFSDGVRAELPEGLDAVGDVFEVVSSETVLFSGREPVIVGLPIPDGADPGRLAVAMLLAVETVLDAPAGEPHWSVVRGVVDADSGLFVVGLPVLPSDGVLLTLVEGDEVAPLRDGEVVPAGEDVLPWSARCVGFGWFNAERANCEADLPWIEARLTEIAQVYRDEGFREPRVKMETECDFFGLSCTPVAFEVLVRWKNSGDCDGGGGGYYRTRTGETNLCYEGSIVGGSGSGDMSSEQVAREVLAHEIFHGVQYAYLLDGGLRDAAERHHWFIEGTAMAVMRFATGGGLRVTDYVRDRRGIADSLYAQKDDQLSCSGLSGILV